MTELSTITLLILGGTGQVGSHLIEQALAHPRVQRVVAPTRRPLIIRDNLLNPLVDFGKLSADEPWWQADAALCALGTTLSQAGSKEQFYRVDHDFVVQSARFAQQAGTPVFVLNSSMGADPDSRSFYLRTKGQTERDLQALDFDSLACVRPSLLDGGIRPDFRPAESMGLWLLKALRPVIPDRYRAVRTSDVAAAMLRAALAPKPGVSVIESEQIERHTR